VTHDAHKSLPGEPHNRDMSNPGEAAFFLIALAIVAALAIGYAVAGVGGIGAVMIALVPVIMLVLVIITVGG